MPVPAQRGGTFLESLSSRVRNTLLSAAESVHYREGDVIFRQDDPSEHLYVVQSGGVAIEIHVPSKGLRRILTLGPGDVFSWSALIEPHIETATARATQASVVLGIKRATLMKLCREDCPLASELYRALARAISARLMATRLQLLDVFANP